MDINTLGIVSVAGITVICYLVALAIKQQTPLTNKWLPTICGAVGPYWGACAYSMPTDTDVITALAVGIVSGLAAPGADQVVKQLRQ